MNSFIWPNWRNQCQNYFFKKPKTLQGNKIKSPFFLFLYLVAFTLTERCAFIANLEYLLVAFGQWSEQSWGSGHWGTGTPDRGTKGPSKAKTKWKGPHKRLRRTALYGLVRGSGSRAGGLAVPTHWAPALGEPLEHDHVWSIITPSQKRVRRLIE